MTTEGLLTDPHEPDTITLPESREVALQIVESLTWPDAPMHAHLNDWNASSWGPTIWREPHGRYNYANQNGYPADCLLGGYDENFRTCSYCGSIHPKDLARILLTTDAKLGGADWKYGWPHKFYVEGIPNPAAGQPACVGSTSDSYTDEHGEYHFRVKPLIAPAPATMHAKWYNMHFADLDSAAFDFLSALIYQRTLVHFYRRPEHAAHPTRISYSAPHRGYQA